MIPVSDARDEARSVMDSIRRLVRGLRLFSRQAENELELSAAQLFVLQQLSATKPESMKSLAKRTFTDQSSVSVVVKRLVDKGLVLKNPSPKDQRSVELRLSAKGLAALKGRPDAFQARLLSALMRMGTAERKHLKHGLELLIESAGMAEEPAEMLSIDGRP
jgi:DNA-binding MarR family transcriptional regulator